LTKVSIHAPARGATTRVRIYDEDKQFQFTRPRGARLFGVVAARRARVSIHAPARGATFWTYLYAAWLNVSIHAPARGATGRALPGAQAARRFNSRARAGRDLAFGGVASRGKVSIHAPARGATSPPSSPPTASTSFNSRARAGRDVSNSKCG